MTFENYFELYLKILQIDLLFAVSSVNIYALLFVFWAKITFSCNISTKVEHLYQNIELNCQIVTNQDISC